MFGKLQFWVRFCNFKSRSKHDQFFLRNYVTSKLCKLDKTIVEGNRYVWLPNQNITPIM
jgi:hypothetical protein